MLGGIGCQGPAARQRTNDDDVYNIQLIIIPSTNGTQADLLISGLLQLSLPAINNHWTVLGVMLKTES